MNLTWTRRGLSDVVRLHEFLAVVNPAAADRAVQLLTRAAERLLAHPRMGEKLSQYEPREVRHLIVGAYEIRYELTRSDIHILRLWHTRENR